MNLFNEKDEKWAVKYRPKTLDELVGHEKIKDILKSGKLINMILYGTPGIGKTTILNILKNEFSYNVYYLNATTIIKEELIDVLNKAKSSFKNSVVFIDEIHRLNKMQQDYLLYFAENDDFHLIAATTENPNKINKPLLSRMKVIYLETLKDKEILKILENIVKKENIKVDLKILEYIAKSSNGDSRIAINNLELVYKKNLKTFSEIKEYIYFSTDKNRVDYISAFIKSMRGSDENATVYWLAVMLETGEDIEYIARRMVIFASEDIGIMNIHAMNVANSCLNSIKNIGMPEARIILANCAVYLAVSPKSNVTYLAINEAIQYIRENGIEKVPYHLTHLGKDKYKYPHDYPNDYIIQKYTETKNKFVRYKNEKKIKEYLERLKGKE